MKILAIESSSAVRSVALCQADESREFRVLAQARDQSRRDGRFASLIEEALRTAGTPRTAVDRIAVGLGPGSLAGIRSALAFALGWRRAGGVAALGFSSLQCLAAQAARENRQGTMLCLAGTNEETCYGAVYGVNAEALVESRSWGPLAGAELSALRRECDYLIELEPLAPIPDAVALGWLACRHPELGDRSLEPRQVNEPRFVKTGGAGRSSP